MGILLERRRSIQEHNRNIRLKRVLGLFEAGLTVKKIALDEQVTPARIYQMLNEALSARAKGVI